MSIFPQQTGKENLKRLGKRWKEKERSGQKEKKILYVEDEKDMEICITTVLMIRLLH